MSDVNNEIFEQRFDQTSEDVNYPFERCLICYNAGWYATNNASILQYY